MESKVSNFQAEDPYSSDLIEKISFKACELTIQVKKLLKGKRDADLHLEILKKKFSIHLERVRESLKEKRKWIENEKVTVGDRKESTKNVNFLLQKNEQLLTLVETNDGILDQPGSENDAIKQALNQLNKAIEAAKNCKFEAEKSEDELKNSNETDIHQYEEQVKLLKTELKVKNNIEKESQKELTRMKTKLQTLDQEIDYNKVRIKNIQDENKYLKKYKRLESENLEIRKQLRQTKFSAIDESILKEIRYDLTGKKLRCLSYPTSPQLPSLPSTPAMHMLRR
ncbi:uncharacterized protein LOC130637117 isoform X2 [Hydractinia symbiolongicarpus]|uniref:uncharacterized protein LOC130637117 isoform X2 n=1 Tax=Hydractinia symbiolongicarpus TaxID=13093 RepID=UPI00254BB5F8|nr:uncharacterized protein LOC130637117 isoform X2 [Hydractinia symbiolongicarpus]